MNFTTQFPKFSTADCCAAFQRICSLFRFGGNPASGGRAKGGETSSTDGGGTTGRGRATGNGSAGAGGETHDYEGTHGTGATGDNGTTGAGIGGKVGGHKKAGTNSPFAKALGTIGYVIASIGAPFEGLHSLFRFGGNGESGGGATGGGTTGSGKAGDGGTTGSGNHGDKGALGTGATSGNGTTGAGTTTGKKTGGRKKTGTGSQFAKALGTLGYLTASIPAELSRWWGRPVSPSEYQPITAFDGLGIA